MLQGHSLLDHPTILKYKFDINLSSIKLHIYKYIAKIHKARFRPYFAHTETSLPSGG